MLFRGKSLGLDINSKGVSWVLASGASDAPVIETFESRLFAEEILRPGLKEKNILAPDAVKSSLSESYLKLLTKEKR
ncbi:MAG: hypothetical protein HGB35_05640, partial [Geobacteraceae bacterium]|nr:hypothetical protein [Geobacteraceae bacterium]